jgi:hypothetical protein
VAGHAPDDCLVAFANRTVSGRVRSRLDSPDAPRLHAKTHVSACFLGITIASLCDYHQPHLGAPIAYLSLKPFDVLMAVGFGNVASNGRGGGALSCAVNLDSLAASEE